MIIAIVVKASATKIVQVGKIMAFYSNKINIFLFRFILKIQFECSKISVLLLPSMYNIKLK